MTLTNILMAGAGSCVGGMARYILGKLIQTSVSGVFPWGTLAVNLIGCLLIGFIYGMLDRGFQLSEPVKIFLTIGFCGGFTTFSTFANENYLLFTGGHIGLFALYALSSIILGFLLLYAGYFLSRI